MKEEIKEVSEISAERMKELKELVIAIWNEKFNHTLTIAEAGFVAGGLLTAIVFQIKNPMTATFFAEAILKSLSDTTAIIIAEKIKS